MPPIRPQQPVVAAERDDAQPAVGPGSLSAATPSDWSPAPATKWLLRCCQVCSAGMFFGRRQFAHRVPVTIAPDEEHGETESAARDSRKPLHQAEVPPVLG